METMRAISLWQPWAELVASEQKVIEKREWKTLPISLVNQRIAIHAAARMDPAFASQSRCSISLARLANLLGHAPILPENLFDLDFGAVVCTAKVVCARYLCRDDASYTLCDCEPTNDVPPVGLVLRHVIRVLPPLPVRGGRRIFILPATAIFRRSTRPLPFAVAVES